VLVGGVVGHRRGVKAGREQVEKEFKDLKNEYFGKNNGQGTSVLDIFLIN